jgi:uncharacterized protein involved in exopolysaccharide biosynthesis
MDTIDYLDVYPESATPSEGEALRHVIRHVLRSWWLILLLAAIAGGAGYAYAKSQKVEYQAATSLLFVDPPYQQVITGGGYNPLDAQRRAKTNSQLLGLSRIADAAAQQVGRGVTPSTIESDVKITASAESDVLWITAKNPNATVTAAIANAVAKSYIKLRNQIDRDSVLATRAVIRQQQEHAPTRTGARQLASQINSIDALLALQADALRVVQRASVPGSPVSPETKRDTALGIVLGGLLGIALALLRPRRRRPA